MTSPESAWFPTLDPGSSSRWTLPYNSFLLSSIKGSFCEEGISFVCFRFHTWISKNKALYGGAGTRMIFVFSLVFVIA